MVSSTHAVCAKGLFIAMISTTVETDKPELEIKPALDLLGNVLEMFVRTDVVYLPTDDGKKDNVNYSLISFILNLLTLFIVVCYCKLRPNFSFRTSK